MQCSSATMRPCKKLKPPKPARKIRLGVPLGGETKCTDKRQARRRADRLHLYSKATLLIPKARSGMALSSFTSPHFQFAAHHAQAVLVLDVELIFAQSDGFCSRAKRRALSVVRE